jgi:hypothetical protein
MNNIEVALKLLKEVRTILASEDEELNDERMDLEYLITNLRDVANARSE